MANSKVTYREIHFYIEDDKTICEVAFDYDEYMAGVANPGRNKKRKEFPPTVNVMDILTGEIARLDFLNW